ncbi:hypothetical protein HDV03_002903 [Kappamyces sp. JEL0829]|nr:hypothetical protein HDV03_002903 [Kappamyces sp. JEL0829]
MTDDQAVAASIIQFLKNQHAKESSENKQSLEVAMQCIQEVFAIDGQSAPVELSKLYGVYKQTMNAAGAKKAPKAAPKEESAAPVAIDSAKAEALKSEGNKLLAAKKFDEAVAKYSAAIEADGTNAVYYANRAAAYSQLGQHESAVYDAKKALQVNPDYSKAYSRLGHAEFCLGNYENAVDAYTLGLEKEPNNASIKQSLAAAKSKVQSSSVSAPGASRGAGGAPGGMPNLAGMDFAAMMRDPNIMNMAQSMMSNPAMANMLNNPALAQMMSGAGGAGGMPDIASMMANPAIAEMANNMMKDPEALNSLMNNPDVAKMAEQYMKK